MKFIFTVIIAFAFLVALTGCETSPESASVSAIPWNKPASWEGPGALGGMGFQGTH